MVNGGFRVCVVAVAGWAGRFPIRVAVVGPERPGVPRDFAIGHERLSSALRAARPPGTALRFAEPRCAAGGRFAILVGVRLDAEQRVDWPVSPVRAQSPVLLVRAAFRLGWPSRARAEWPRVAQSQLATIGVGMAIARPRVVLGSGDGRCLHARQRSVGVAARVAQTATGSMLVRPAPVGANLVAVESRGSFSGAAASSRTRPGIGPREERWVRRAWPADFRARAAATGRPSVPFRRLPER